MIELVEIYIIANQLRDVMMGNIIKSLKIYPISRYYTKGFFGFQYILENMEINLNEGNIKYEINSIVNNIFTRGKLLFFDITNNTTNQKLTLMTNFSKSGRYCFNKPKIPSFSLEIENNLGEIIQLYFEDFTNKTQFKCFAYMEEYEFAIREIGNDYSNPLINLNYFKNKITCPRMKNITISRFLINQKWISGIGEYLRSEIIYESTLNPKRLLGTLSNNDINCLFNSIIKVLNNSYKQGGIISEKPFTPNGLFGTYKCNIYKVPFLNIDDKNIKVNIEDDKGKLYWYESNKLCI